VPFNTWFGTSLTGLTSFQHYFSKLTMANLPSVYLGIFNQHLKPFFVSN